MSVGERRRPPPLHRPACPVLTALHSVVNHCGLHSPISHCCTTGGLSRCAHSPAWTAMKSLPAFWTQTMSRRCVPLPHGTLHLVDKRGNESARSDENNHQTQQTHTAATWDQGLLYHVVVGTHGPPLQAFISAGLSPTQSPPPPPSLTPPRVRHTTSLFCTPGPHWAEH